MPTLENLVDLERYPIADVNAARYELLASRCRSELANSGVSILEGFLHPYAMQQLVDEATTLAPLGHPSDVPGTPYLEVPTNDWPADHPRKRSAHTRLTAVAYDLFPADAVLRRLYESDDLLAFLRTALGFDIFRYDDPLGGLNLAAMYDGDQLAWHFDQTDFVVSLAIQSSDAGGEFECVQRIRDQHDEHYAEVQALLDGDRQRVTTLPMHPGTLMLFEGRYSIHRVAPIVGPTPRFVGLFGYDRKPGTCSSDLLREIRYGRTQSL